MLFEHPYVGTKQVNVLAIQNTLEPHVIPVLPITTAQVAELGQCHHSFVKKC